MKPSPRKFLNSYFLILNFLCAVDVATNAVSLTGAYQTGATNASGSITVGK